MMTEERVEKLEQRLNQMDVGSIRFGPRPDDPEERQRTIDRIAANIQKALSGEKKRMESVLRCKMRVEEVLHAKSADGTTNQERVKLRAVYGDAGTENAKWSKWTPSAGFDIHINNPDAMGKLSAGHEFYVDFTPVK